MKINEEKLRKCVEFLYVKETLGKALYEKINEYPNIQERCNDLLDYALKMQISSLKKEKDYETYKHIVQQKILEIDLLCAQIPLYRKSLLFFDEDLKFNPCL